MDHEQAELHTPPLNKIGLPDGLTEYAIRRNIRDLIDEVGSDLTGRTVGQILADELRRTLR